MATAPRQNKVTSWPTADDVRIRLSERSTFHCVQQALLIAHQNGWITFLGGQWQDGSTWFFPMTVDGSQVVLPTNEVLPFLLGLVFNRFGREGAAQLAYRAGTFRDQPA